MSRRGGAEPITAISRNKRAKLVNLTTTGIKTYKKLEERQIPWSNRHSGHLKEKDLATTLATLKKMVQRFNHR
jgi:hypothetical protein